MLFLGLALLLGRSLGVAGWRRPVIAAAILSFVYGCAMELAQIPIEGRELNPLDFLFNGLGALAGAWLLARSGRPS